MLIVMIKTNTSWQENVSKLVSFNPVTKVIKNVTIPDEQTKQARIRQDKKKLIEDISMVRQAGNVREQEHGGILEFKGTQETQRYNDSAAENREQDRK